VGILLWLGLDALSRKKAREVEMERELGPSS